MIVANLAMTLLDVSCKCEFSENAKNDYPLNSPTSSTSAVSKKVSCLSVVHTCLKHLLDFLLSIAHADTHFYISSMAHQEFVLTNAILGKSTILPKEVVVISAQILSLIANHLVAPPINLKWERDMPRFLQDAVTNLAKHEQKFEGSFQYYNENQATKESSVVAHKRMIRQAVASKIKTVYSKNSFPIPFLKLCREKAFIKGVKDSKDFGTDLSYAVMHTQPDYTSEKFVSQLFALLEGQHGWITEPTNRIEMNAIRFPEILDILASTVSALTDVHLEQVLTRLDIL
jgi:hypothetical protein